MKTSYNGPHALVSCRKVRYSDEKGNFLGYQRSGACRCGQEFVLDQRLDPRIREAFEATDEIVDGARHFGLFRGRNGLVESYVLGRLDRVRELNREVVAPLGDGMRPAVGHSSLGALLRTFVAEKPLANGKRPRRPL